MRYVKPWSLFQNVLMAHKEKKGRLLGLDVGDKYVGLAVSDSSNKIASPLRVLLRKKTNVELMATDLQSLVSKFSLVGFVIGAPFDRFCSRNPDAMQMQLLIHELSKTGKLEGVCYTHWEETFTSQNVELLLQSLTLHPVEAKTILDKFAATGILQAYLDYANKKQRAESLE